MDSTADRLTSQSVSPVFTLTASCPDCGHALKLCQAKAGPFFLGCRTFPRCAFRCAYDPVLQRLRDQVERLKAELVFAKMQAQPIIEDAPLTAEERRRDMTTWADVAHRWGVQP